MAMHVAGADTSGDLPVGDSPVHALVRVRGSMPALVLIRYHIRRER